MFPENRLANWYKNLAPNIKLAFFSTIVLGLICHIYMLTNKWVNLDDIVQLVDKMDRTTSGRWFLQYPSAISSEFSMPWLNGFLTIVYSAVMSVFVIKMFNVKSSINTILISGILVTFPTIGSLMPFMNTQDSYQFGAMLAGIAAYLLVKYKNGYILSTILLTLSLAIYQTYLGYSAGLIMLYIIIELLKDKDNFKHLLKVFIKMAVAFLLALALYIFVSRVIFGHLLVDYKGLSSMGNIPLNKLPEIVFSTYAAMFKFLVGIDFNYHFPFMKYLFIATAIFTVFLITFIVKKNKLPKNKLLFLILNCLLFPIVINSIYIMSWQAGVMLRMAYGYTVCFIFPLILIEFLLKNSQILEYDTEKASVQSELEPNLELEKSSKSKQGQMIKDLVFFSTWFITLTIFLSVYNNIYVTNKAYFKVGMSNTYSHAYGNRIMTRIEATPGYTTNTKIKFIGNPDSRTSYTEKFDTDDIKPFVISNHLTRLYSFRLYPARFLGFKNSIKDFDKYEGEILSHKDEIEKMPIYPDPDSIKFIGDELYVKFKDID